MATLHGTVGAEGANAPADVRTVQRLLAPRMADLDLPALRLDGVCGSATIRAIRVFQVRILGDYAAGGRIHPGDRTLALLAEDSPAARQRETVRARRARAQMSGAAWWEEHGARFPDSRDIADLRPAFAAALTAFTRALARAGAHVAIEATQRDPRRAWIVRTAVALARGELAARAVAPHPDVAIIWNHGDEDASRAAAEAMVALFDTLHPPAPDSPALEGNAAVMAVRWFAPIAVVDAHGGTVRLDRPRHGDEHPALARLARGYGVVRAPLEPSLWLSAAG